MKLVTVRELAELLNVSQNTVYSMIEKNEIPFIKIKGTYRFDQEEVLKHLSNNPKTKGGKNE